MFLMAVTTKSNFLKWILSIGLVLTLFSISYFYIMMPGADSQYFRGLTEYFFKTRSLDPSPLNLNYYQWPAFFLLADIVTSVSGLSLVNYEFLLYAIIAFLLATALYIYASKKHKMNGFLTVAAFFISITYFINYQSVPFSLALGLLFVLLMFEPHKKSAASTVIIIVLYVSLLLSHLFVPVFFVLYSLLRSLFDKNRQNKRFYRNFVVFSLVSYLVVQITIANFSFEQVVRNILDTPVTYSDIVLQTVGSSFSIPIVQFFSRVVTITTVGLCFGGFLLLILKRKMDVIDKAILITGIVYSALGFALNTLGYRAIAVVFIPISLGAAFLFKSKLKPFIGGLFLILLILFLFVPLHQSFNREITFQTRETYLADNFFIDHYHWEKPGFVIADFRTMAYLQSKLNHYVYIYDSWEQSGGRGDGILFTPQFAGEPFGNYSSVESLSQGERLDIVYNDGFSYVLIKSGN